LQACTYAKKKVELIPLKRMIQKGGRNVKRVVFMAAMSERAVKDSVLSSFYKGSYPKW
jgi:hypothetical protein